MSLRVAAFFATAKKYAGWALVIGPIVGISLQGYLYLGDLQSTQGDIAARLQKVEANEKRLVDALGGVSTKIAGQGEQLNSLVDSARDARTQGEAAIEGLEDGQNALQSEIADLRVYVADNLGEHRGKHEGPGCLK